MTDLSPVPTPTAKSRLAQATSQYAAAMALYQVGKQAWDWHTRRKTYTIEILENDALFLPLVSWVEEHAADAKPVQHLEAITSDIASGGMVPYDSSLEYFEQRMALKYVPSTYQTQQVAFDGHTIKVWVVVPEMGGQIVDKTSLLRRLCFSAQSQEGHLAIRSLMESVRNAQRVTQKSATLWIRGNYGSWEKRRDTKLRDLNTVILPQGQMERITADLENFLASEDDHLKRGIPFHRGYCFFGPPGTGKTSLARGLAKEYGLDLYYLPLGSAKSDLDLSSIISDIGPRSILLMEDIDIFTAVERTDNKDGATLSGFLNSLDGAMTPEGLITILTSNNLEAIDPAILRPGRVDLLEEIKPLTDEQASRLYTLWYGREPLQPLQALGRTSADLCGILKANFNDPDKAEKQILAGGVYGRC